MQTTMRSPHFCNNLAPVFTFICLFQVNVAKNLAPPLLESPKSEEALLPRNPIEDFLDRIELRTGDRVTRRNRIENAYRV